MTDYKLINIASSREFDDTGWLLDDPQGGAPSLIRAIYEKKQLEDRGADHGIYRFADWLPVSHELEGSSAPVTYRSDALANYLGLHNLWITFSGWWPERGARMNTCSFKETEAFSVCGRLAPDEKRVLVVASAGNTARAFARVCSENNIPLLLCVPEDNLDALWFDKPLRPCVRLVAAASGGDYFDAIHIGNQLVSDPMFFAEGGAKNIARRDGMGTTTLSAAVAAGRIPDVYFQAVGSGTGAIAAWEANQRLIADGRFGSHKMRLVVSQNAPFLPMYKAWHADSRDMLPYPDDDARRDAEIIDAKVLSNRRPPWGMAGGLYDALHDTNGTVLAVTNDELRAASLLFEDLEGVDIHPAAAAAVASLMCEATEGRIDPDAQVMLNITGGGEERRRASLQAEFSLLPSFIVPLGTPASQVIEQAKKLF